MSLTSFKSIPRLIFILIILTEDLKFQEFSNKSNRYSFEFKLFGMSFYVLTTKITLKYNIMFIVTIFAFVITLNALPIDIHGVVLNLSELQITE